MFLLQMNSSPSHRTTDSASQPEVSSRLRKTWKEIEDVKQQIRITMDEIEKANVSLSKLRTVEKELLEAAAATALLISPSKFQHIPVDIIGEIAGHLFPRPSKISPQDKYAYFRGCFSVSRTSNGPWPLTYVCRSWRTGILSLPWLWSSFSIITNRSNPQLLSTVIQRTANHPLSLDVSLFSEGASDLIISLLVSHSRRWKNIKLSGNTGPTPLLPLQGQLPELERLELCLGQRSTRSDPWRNSNEEQSIFEDAPKLVELKLEAIPATDLGVRVNLKFPLRQMQRVCHRYYQSEPFFKLETMANFVNLSDLSLDTAYPGLLASDPPTPVVTLPRVSSLGLQSVSILTSLRLPSLTSLQFDHLSLNRDETQVITTFLTAQSESFEFKNWTLGSLTVTSGSLSPSFIDILLHAALQNLHTLYCEYREFQNGSGEWDTMSDILALLTWTPPLQDPNLSGLITSEWHEINIMPHLHNLTLRFSSSWFEYGVFDLMREVIISRMHLDDVVEASGQDSEMTAHRADAINQIGNPALEFIPARLEHFSIGYMDSIPDVTMEDLSTLIQGKFNVLLEE